LIKKSFKAWISLLFLAILVQKIDVQGILKSLLLVKLLYLLASLALIPLLEFSRCIKWRIILNKLKYPISLRCLILNNLKAYPLGVVTPSNIGEMIRAYYLHKCGVPKVESAVSVILDRFLEILSTFSIGFLGFIILPINFSLSSKIIAVLFLLSIMMLFSNRVLHLLLTIFATFLKRVFRGKYIKSEQIDEVSSLFFETFSNRRLFLTGFILSLFQWTIIVFQFKIILLSFGYKPQLYDLVAVVGISWIAALIPITISGLGIRESVGVFLFNSIGIPDGVAFTVFLLTIILYQIIMSIVGILLLFKK
jgi:uncharacterized protein (TIRG00374 family)